MSTAVKLSESIEYCARVRKIAEQNPELTYELIKDLLIAQQESVHRDKLEPYVFDNK